MPSVIAEPNRVNDFVIKFANVNGTGSASANSPDHEGDLSHGRAGHRQELLSRRTFKACPRGTRFA